MARSLVRLRDRHQNDNVGVIPDFDNIDVNRPRNGTITSCGGGALGFMRSLAVIGPLTVPQITQMRPTMSDERSEADIRLVESSRQGKSEPGAVKPREMLN